jgi:branched-chain amino acid transport system substrate-binding protein
MFRWISVRLVVLATFVLTLAACGAEGQEVTPVTPQARGPSEYRIGLNYDLTGSYATTGEDTVKAIQVYFGKVRSTINGVPVRLIVCDSQSSPDQAVACARKLIEQDRVHVLLGPIVAINVQPVIPVAQAARVPHFFTTPYVDPPPTSYSFLVGYTVSPYTTIPMLQYFRDRGFRRIGVIATTDASGQIPLDDFLRLAPRFGITEYKVERHAVTDTDVTGQLASIKSFNPDAIFISSSGIASLTVMRGMQQLGMSSIPTWISGANASNRFWQAARDVLPAETYYSAWTEPELADTQDVRDELLRFMQEYKSVYGVDADIFAKIYVDVGRVVAHALQQSGGDPDSMKRVLESGQPMPTVATVRFSADSHAGCKEGCKTAVMRMSRDSIGVLQRIYR